MELISKMDRLSSKGTRYNKFTSKRNVRIFHERNKTTLRMKVSGK